MKKQLAVAFGIAVLATPAFATKARLEALGEDNFGSYYINDNRNIFLNPAKIVDQKDLVTFEFGQSSPGAGADSAAAPRAEGGIIKSMGNLVYGLHFGNSSVLASELRGAITNGQEVNPIDLFVGGDAGVKWGANLTYENFDGNVNNERISSNAVRLRGGIVTGDLEVLANVSVKGDVKNRTQNEVMEGKSSYLVGAGYLLNNYKFFADYTNVAAEFGTLSATPAETTVQRIRVGVGRAEKLNDKAILYTKLAAVQRTDEVDSPAGDTEVIRRTVPAVVGLEYEATSWLAFRASVEHNLYGAVKNEKPSPKTSNTLASTAVNAGASLTFGEFRVDGLISTNSNGDASAPTEDTAGGNGALRTDSLMTRVGMVYHF